MGQLNEATLKQGEKHLQPEVLGMGVVFKFCKLLWTFWELLSQSLCQDFGHSNSGVQLPS